MKRKDLIELIKDTIYSELPDIISEIKSTIKEEILSESPQQNGEEIREHIRTVHGTKAPPNKNLLTDYKGEKVASGKGVMDWFTNEVNEGNTVVTKEHKHSKKQLTDFMSKTFGKNIR